jgi:endonuclease/exonuclease/phosphatase family metal-dependent hydrolase
MRAGNDRRVVLISAALLAACAVALHACASEPRPARVPAPGQPALTVLSYNVNYGIPGDAATLDAVFAPKADVVLLQETTAEWEEQIRPRSKDYGAVHFKEGPGAGGMAVLSKYAIVEQEWITPPEGGWFPALRLVLRTPLGLLQVLSVHLRPQMSESGSVVSGYLTTPPVRESEIAKYAARLDPQLPTLIAGDFNEGRRGMAIAYLERRGFKSQLQNFSSSTDTWRWRTSVGTVSAELDHVVLDERLDALDVQVLGKGNSDHFPLVVVVTKAASGND